MREATFFCIKLTSTLSNVCLLHDVFFNTDILYLKHLNVHRQISKKRFFEKYCSCDKACQFSALQGTP